MGCFLSNIFARMRRTIHMMISYPTTLDKDILFLNYYLIH